jgi:rfaE bifunctional protein nucleotidyltransferase chain/domain
VLPITKQIAFSDISARREQLREQNKTLVFTNGCFDLLHVGHIYSLETAKKEGDALWVGVNSDASVRALKSATRPIYPQEARLYLLGALQCVDGLILFDGTDCARELGLIQPDVYVKSGHYALETLNPNERRMLEKCSAHIRFIPPLPDWSTTKTLERIRELFEKEP